jgi:putative thioredoxin
VMLAKVNVDENPGVARRFGISGIPAVKAFRDGQVVDEFVGAQPEALVRQFVERNLPSPAADVLSKAASALEEGKVALAKTLLEEARKAAPSSERLALLTASVALAEADLPAAKEALSGVDEHGQLAAERKSLEARIAFVEACAGVKEKGEPIDRLFAQANCLAAEGDYQQALDLFFRVLTMEKGYRDGAAKEAMVSVFEIVGKRSPLADEYRDKMASILY